MITFSFMSRMNQKKALIRIRTTLGKKYGKKLLKHQAQRKLRRLAALINLPIMFFLSIAFRKFFMFLISMAILRYDIYLLSTTGLQAVISCADYVDIVSASKTTCPGCEPGKSILLMELCLMFIIDLILQPYRFCVIIQNATIGYVAIARIRTSMPDMASAPAMTLWKNMEKAEPPVFEAGFIAVFQETIWFDLGWLYREITSLHRQKNHLNHRFLH